jgi:hypothetical protein
MRFDCFQPSAVAIFKKWDISTAVPGHSRLQVRPTNGWFDYLEQAVTGVSLEFDRTNPFVVNYSEKPFALIQNKAVVASRGNTGAP